MGFVHTVDI